VFVKICGITNASDALLAVAMGAEVLGFVFAESKRQVTPEQAGEIIQLAGVCIKVSAQTAWRARAHTHTQINTCRHMRGIKTRNN
jgi:phosphoribosylanthranilate isomerase